MRIKQCDGRAAKICGKHQVALYIIGCIHILAEGMLERG